MNKPVSKPHKPRVPKPCKGLGGEICPLPRYGTASLCRSHWFSSQRVLKAQAKVRKLARKLGSKKHQESERKSLVRKLDAVFSKLIRSVGKCLRCGKSADQVKLDCSHIVGRANLAVRWDFLNCKALCFRCHKVFWHGEPALAAEWLKTVRTPEELAELNRRANSVRKWTNAEMAALLAELEEKLRNLGGSPS